MNYGKGNYYPIGMVIQETGEAIPPDDIYVILSTESLTLTGLISTSTIDVDTNYAGPVQIEKSESLSLYDVEYNQNQKKITITSVNNVVPGNEINGTIDFIFGDITKTVTITQEATEYNLILQFAPSGQVQIAEATTYYFDNTENPGYAYYLIPTNTVIQQDIVCHAVVEKDSTFSFTNLTIAYNGSTALEVADVRVADTMTITGVTPVALSYRNCQAQNVSTVGFQTEVATDCHPYDLMSDSSFSSVVAQRFTLSNADYSTIKVTFNGTVASTVQISQLSCRSIEVVGVGGNTLYQHSIQNAIFENVTLKDQVVSLLTLTGVDFNQFKTITLDNVTYTSNDIAEYFYNSILAVYTGSGLILTFKNGSTGPNDEQKAALEAKNITVIIE